MDDEVTRVLSDLVARTRGPMWFRLVLQPVVAIVFGVRGGLRLAVREHAGSRARDSRWRVERFRQSLTDVGKVALFGGLLDLVFQWLVLKAIYPGEAILVVLLIVILPYLAVRTLVFRLAGRRS